MSNTRNNPPANNLKVDMTPEVSIGTYSNLAIISHSPTEMTLDFAQMMPGTPNPVVRQRIIMNPVHAKRLLAALSENLNKYEQTFGRIEEPSAPIEGDTVPYDLLGKA